LGSECYCPCSGGWVPKWQAPKPQPPRPTRPQRPPKWHHNLNPGGRPRPNKKPNNTNKCGPGGKKCAPKYNDHEKQNNKQKRSDVKKDKKKQKALIKVMKQKSCNKPRKEQTQSEKKLCASLRSTMGKKKFQPRPRRPPGQRKKIFD